MSPTINVNLKPCDCGIDYAGRPPPTTCVATSIPIPCAIRRSVTFTVRLGECRCPSWMGSDGWEHRVDCPALPVRVTCSISGDGTWAGSEVSYVQDTWPHETLILNACRERWALVKALVLGGRLFPSPVPDTVAALVHQRDAVFSALADMARAEEAVLQAQQRFYEACPIVLRTERREGRPSVGRLATYIEHLIAQAEVLP